jgi:branched-chain amino acid transport system permease protein
MHLPSLNVLVQVILVGLLTGGVYALMAAGLTLIFGVMKVINIAHGAFLVLSAYIAYWLFTFYGLDPFLSVIVSVPLFILIGVVFQRYMLSRMRGGAGLTVLLTLPWP